MMALGQNDKAGAVFHKLISKGEADLDALEAPDFFAKFGERLTVHEQQANARYLKALGFFGLGEKEKAKAEVQYALNLNNSLVWARVMLKECSR